MYFFVRLFMIMLQFYVFFNVFFFNVLSAIQAINQSKRFIPLLFDSERGISITFSGPYIFMHFGPDFTFDCILEDNNR